MRVSIVSGSPTPGGFAGYFVNGTSVIVRNAPAPSSADRARGPNVPTRPYAQAKTSAKNPPSAAPMTTVPVSSPIDRWTPRDTSAGPAASSKSIARWSWGSPNR